ncbi:MAG: hypothetical protein K9N23_11505 [Akkermansiaceae bacterium]|nr:hypothetical protein [Akkermansiaceae bacterium]
MNPKSFRPHCQFLPALAALPVAFAAPVEMTGPGSYTQDFDTLPVTGSTSTSNEWLDDTTLEAWYAQQESGTLDNIRALDGDSSAGALYSFGVVDATERALGSVGSGTPDNFAYGVLLHNTSATTLTLHSLSYTGEQWRCGGNINPHQLTFSYQTSADAISDLAPADVVPAGWTALPAADFTGPIAETSSGALDGNLPANRTAIGVNPAISVPAGQYVMLRWHDVDDDDDGYDHGLAIDNLSISWVENNSPLLAMTVTLDAIDESAGAAAATGTVSIPAALGEVLTVTLESTNTAKATVPASVTITTGDTSAEFPINVLDNLLADGDVTVTLTATATGYLNAAQSITVTDNDSPIQVEITPGSIAEDAGSAAATGTVSLPSVTPVPVTVNLVSSKPDEATVPVSVTVAANERTAEFQVAAVDDLDLDGSQSVKITASAGGYSDGWSLVTVTDNEVAPTPTLSAGGIAFTGFNADGNANLAFVALVPIPPWEVIYITDKSWNGGEIDNGGAFSATEGTLTWAAPAAGVAAGEIVLLNDLSTTALTASVGTLVRAGSFVLSGSGDTAYAYQGATVGEPTVFLAVIANTGSDSTANTGLSTNQIILLPSNKDIAAYTGSRSNRPTYAGYLDSLADTTTNWITEAGIGDQSTNTTAPDVPFDTTAFTLGGGTDYATWAAANAPGETADQDFDGDGLANGVEYFMGTPGNAFTVNPGIVEAAGVKTITWPMNPEAIGVSYRVLTSETLAADSWTAASASVVGSDLVFTLPTATAKLFVRLEVTVSGS